MNKGTSELFKLKKKKKFAAERIIRKKKQI